MPFMEPQVTNKQSWWEVETDQGTWFLQTKMVGFPTPKASKNQVFNMLKDYVDGEIEEAHIIDGYGARLSAPGYMDKTEWTVHKTPEEARDYLIETFDEEPLVIPSPESEELDAMFENCGDEETYPPGAYEMMNNPSKRSKNPYIPALNYKTYNTWGELLDSYQYAIEYLSSVCDELEEENPSDQAASVIRGQIESQYEYSLPNYIKVSKMKLEGFTSRRDKNIYRSHNKESLLHNILYLEGMTSFLESYYEEAYNKITHAHRRLDSKWKSI